VKASPGRAGYHREDKGFQISWAILSAKEAERDKRFSARPGGQGHWILSSWTETGVAIRPAGKVVVKGSAHATTYRIGKALQLLQPNTVDPKLKKRSAVNAEIYGFTETHLG
jgi:hypothetical protein